MGEGIRQEEWNDYMLRVYTEQRTHGNPSLAPTGKDTVVFLRLPQLVMGMLLVRKNEAAFDHFLLVWNSGIFKISSHLISPYPYPYQSSRQRAKEN